MSCHPSPWVPDLTAVRPSQLKLVALSTCTASSTCENSSGRRRNAREMGIATSRRRQPGRRLLLACSSAAAASTSAVARHSLARSPAFMGWVGGSRATLQSGGSSSNGSGAAAALLDALAAWREEPAEREEQHLGPGLGVGEPHSHGSQGPNPKRGRLPRGRDCCTQVAQNARDKGVPPCTILPAAPPAPLAA